MRFRKIVMPIIAFIIIGSLIVFTQIKQNLVPNKLEAIQKQKTCVPIHDQDAWNNPKWRPSILTGVPANSGNNYTEVLVIAKVGKENIDWIHQTLPSLRTAIYVADDPSAPLHPPENKGNEAMIYLTYIIDHYDNLPDIMMFMHSHHFGWHNNAILDNNAYEILARLNREKVIREGYMNLRCRWFPGCPDWIHPGHLQENGGKMEEWELGQVWSELFPQDAVPQLLAQPCCGQFALARERVLTIPQDKFIHYREWLLQTDLPSCLSGRVWEYLWQYVFLGTNTLCPNQHVCYCDGYGICFENDRKFDDWLELKQRQHDLEKELEEWHQRTKPVSDIEGNQSKLPEVGRNVTLVREIEQIKRWLVEKRAIAIYLGNNPLHRAAIVGNG